ncbi:MAG: NERD domain-containing protein [Oscillospiraceae bacterium]|nr:NERD domain-containing protein [Oscillospiraceae bacterium]
MAKIVRRHLINTVKQSYLKYTLLLALCTAAVVFCAVTAVYCFGITLVFIPFIVFIMLKLKRQREISAAGARGEKRVLSLLSRLPNDFYVITDIELVIGHKTAQMDYIIVGPTGVFVVETKNLKGNISGNANDEMLCKTKHFGNGNSETKEFYNPIFQVSTHARLLSQLLIKNGYYNEIATCVYFSHPLSEVDLRGENPNARVFWGNLGGDRLLMHILSYKGHELTGPKIKRLKKLIFSHCR